MPFHPHIDPAPYELGGAVQLTGPIGGSLRGPSFIALQVSPRDMAMVLAGVARLLAGERVIYCADGCNRFDAYRFSHWARCMGLDPREILSRVYLSRAFTVHQLAALATREFPRLPTKPTPPLVVVLGLESLFLDEQIPRFEREHLYKKTLNTLYILRRRGFSILVTHGEDDDRDGAPSRRPWIQMTARAADVLARLRRLAGGAFTFETMGGRRPQLMHETIGSEHGFVYTEAEILI